MALAPGTTYAPDWLLRGGYSRLVLVPVDETGATATNKGHIDSASVRPLAYAAEAERRVTGLGTLDTRARVRRIAPEVVGWPEIQQIRAWARACYRVRGVVVAQGRGRHILIGEPVPPVTEPFSDGRASLEGDRVLLETHVYDAAWTEDVDLLALSEWSETDEAEVVLPAAGLRVWAWVPVASGVAGTATITALSAAGATLTSATSPGGGQAAELVLPAGTWTVRVTAAAVTGSGLTTRAVLTTYRPSVGRAVVVPDGLCAVYPVAPEATAPAAPEFVATEREDGSATFTWGAVTNADRYLLTWGFDEGGPYPNAVVVTAPTVTATVSAAGTDPVYAVVYAITDA